MDSMNLLNKLHRYRRKRPKVDASILDSALSHTRRSDVSEKEIDDNDQLNMNG